MKIPMVRKNDDFINPVKWVDEEDYQKFIDNGYINATEFYRQKEAHYAKLRRQVEKQIIEQHVQG